MEEIKDDEIKDDEIKDAEIEDKITFKMWIRDTIYTLLVSIVIVFVIINFIGQVGKIPSSSMENTLLVGDRILINKFTKLVREPEVGEVVVFKQDGVHMVKRVIAKSGDVVKLEEGRVVINGTPIVEDYIVGETFKLNSDVEYDDGYYVGPGEYFVMGDNREDSADSRYFGNIKEENIVGVTNFRVYPLNRIGKFN